ncbi:MAG TPA: DUF3592 domain-containing protein [Candidatus Solibacter sp.]|nr:DUF3592 domain-containing protein [Candidatus Solibacter sp.]
MNAAVWFYIVATLGALIWLSWHYALAVASTRWPRVTGKILRAWAERTDSEYAYYSPRVEYAYEVEGTLHRSTTVWLTGDKSMRRGRAERIAATYQAGDPVEVWYDPTKPARATLKPGGAGWLLATIVVVSVAGPLLALAFTETGRRVLGELGIQVE